MIIHKKEGQKTAIKLLNKYAESYNILKEEYKSLEDEVKDLRLNIKINKEIIADILNLNSPNYNSKTITEKKLTNIISKLNEELNTIYSQCEKLSKEKLNLRNRLLKQEELYKEVIDKLKSENENYSNKIFLFQQNLKEKNNIIEKLKLTAERYKEGIIYEKEIFITQPSKLICQINDELFLYKSLSTRLINSIHQIREDKERYENLNEKLQTENSKLRHKYIVSVYSANREKETILTELSAISQNTKKNDNDDCRSAKTYINYDREKLKKKLDNMSNYSKTGNALNDFDEILRHCGINLMLYREISGKKENQKFIEIIEMLFKRILDKNMQISLLEKEIANLTVKNFELNKINMNLYVENNNLLHNKDSTLNTTKKIQDNLSLEGNNNSNTKNLILKSLDVYGKQIRKEEEDNMNNPKDSLSLQNDLDRYIARKERIKTDNIRKKYNYKREEYKDSFNTDTIKNNKRQNYTIKNNEEEEEEEDSDIIESKYIEFESDNDNYETIQNTQNKNDKITANCLQKENNKKISFSCSTLKYDNEGKKNHYFDSFVSDSDINNI